MARETRAGDAAYRATPQDPFRILVVCVGNVCRSPLAERLLLSRLGAGFEVRSSGVRALVGEPMDPTVARLATELGADPTSFVARQFEPDQAEWADLVLVATRDLRSRVLAEVPTALRRTFTLLEAGRLVTAVSAPEPT
ncbi:hypothetical protein, partial [Nocardioides sp.]|uniref:arsenate reductase/protein-tyrosine-phosphatase family protein n=1 Tax=Nocardioides sp. TaxID=35761 RepID=UPI002ED5E344